MLPRAFDLVVVVAGAAHDPGIAALAALAELLEPVGCEKSAWACELGRCDSFAVGMMVTYVRTPALSDLCTGV